MRFSTSIALAIMVAIASCGCDRGNRFDSASNDERLSEILTEESNSNQSESFATEYATHEDALTATITCNASDAPKKRNEVEIDFNLTNNSELPVRIWARAFSFGAYAWSLKVKTDDGRCYHLQNAQNFWGFNAPYPCYILPGETYTQKFHIFENYSPNHFKDWRWSLGESNFYGEITEQPVDRKLTVQGQFFMSGNEARFGSDGDDPRYTTWQGDIETNEITVNFAP